MNKLLLHTLTAIGLLSPRLAIKAMEPQSMEQPTPRVIDGTTVVELLNGIRSGNAEKKAQAFMVAKQLLGLTQNDTIFNDQRFLNPGPSARMLVHQELGISQTSAHIKNTVIESRYLPALSLLQGLVEADYRPAFTVACRAALEWLKMNAITEGPALETLKKIFLNPALKENPRTKALSVLFATTTSDNPYAQHLALKTIANLIHSMSTNEFARITSGVLEYRL